MSIGILILEVQFPGCKSLKEKRSRIKPLIARLHREFNISIAELERMDTWNDAIIGCALISNDRQFIQNSLQSIIQWINRNWLDIVLVDEQIELVN